MEDRQMTRIIQAKAEVDEAYTAWVYSEITDEAFFKAVEKLHQVTKGAE